MPGAVTAAPGGSWTATWLVALLSCLLPLLAHAAFGLIHTPDSGAYLLYAEALRAGPLPAAEALLRSGPQPPTLFRTAGFPALLAALQWLAPGGWPMALLAVQVAAQATVAMLAHRVALRLGLRGALAVIAALMPAGGHAVVAQVSLMTDAVYGALFSLAALILLRAALAGGGLRAVALAGLLLGLAMPVREATLFLLVGFLPLGAIAAGPGVLRRLAGPALLAAPVLLAAAWMMAENERRSGFAVLSTSRQIVMVQATLPALARGVPIYHGDDAFDRAARETVVPHGYAGIDPLIARMFEAGLSSPEIAALASARYLRAWREQPLEMLRGMAVRLPVKMFWVSFMPVDTAAELHRQAGDPRPWFGREAELLRRLGQGSPLAALLLAALALGRAIGLAVTVAAMLAPLLLPRRDPRWLPLLGAWLVCGGLIGVYLPVHVEGRYLVPIVPLICLLGVAVLAAAWRRRRSVAHI